MFEALKFHMVPSALDGVIDYVIDYTGEDDEHKHEAAMADCAHGKPKAARQRAP